MLKLINELEEFDNMFRRVDSMMNYPLSANMRNKGLKRLINRPYNTTTKKDNTGKIIGYNITTVYTPFKKSDIKVLVENNILMVKCGTENKIKDEEMDYCGISYQSYEFSLPLADNININKITAKAEDGMLYIDIPVKEVVSEKKTLQINVN